MCPFTDIPEGMLTLCRGYEVINWLDVDNSCSWLPGIKVTSAQKADTKVGSPPTGKWIFWPGTTDFPTVCFQSYTTSILSSTNSSAIANKMILIYPHRFSGYKGYHSVYWPENIKSFLVLVDIYSVFFLLNMFRNCFCNGKSSLHRDISYYLKYNKINTKITPAVYNWNAQDLKQNITERKNT